MNILCIICMDQLETVENLQSTRCGHIFHHHCLSYWIQNSNTCPQCRKGVKSNDLLRVYPTFSDEQSRESAELQSSLDDALQELGRLRTACEEKDIRLKHITDTNNSKEQRRRERLASTLESQSADMVELRRQLECLKKEKDDLKRQLHRHHWENIEIDQTHQVDMLNISLECTRARELVLIRELQQLRHDSVIREAVICIISGTLGIAFGILFYPYIYPIPVQQSCWEKSVGFVSNYINRLF